MFWRVVSAIGVLFWAVMCGLLIRDSYFPSESRFKEVPPGLVLKRFIAQQDAAPALAIRRGKQRLGHVSISAARPKNPAAAAPGDVFDLRVAGNVASEAFGTAGGNASFASACELAGGERLRRFALDVRWQPSKEAEHPATTVTVTWGENDSSPLVRVRQGGQVVLDEEQIRELLPFATRQAASQGITTDAALSIKAREGTMDLAGKRRDCHILRISIGGLAELGAFFSTAGELLRVELPGGLSLINESIPELDTAASP